MKGLRITAAALVLIIAIGAVVPTLEFRWARATHQQSATPQAGDEPKIATLLWQTDGEPDVFGRPSRLTVDPEGNLWVAAMDESAFHILSPDGTEIEIWGGAGTGPGQFGPIDEDKYTENQGPAVA